MYRGIKLQKHLGFGYCGLTLGTYVGLETLRILFGALDSTDYPLLRVRAGPGLDFNFPEPLALNRPPRQPEAHGETSEQVPFENSARKNWKLEASWFVCPVGAFWL